MNEISNIKQMTNCFKFQLKGGVKYKVHVNQTTSGGENNNSREKLHLNDAERNPIVTIDFNKLISETFNIKDDAEFSLSMSNHKKRELSSGRSAHNTSQPRDNALTPSNYENAENYCDFSFQSQNCSVRIAIDEIPT